MYNIKIKKTFFFHRQKQQQNASVQHLQPTQHMYLDSVSYIISKYKEHGMKWFAVDEANKEVDQKQTEKRAFLHINLGILKSHVLVLSTHV